ncbi:hypothetical protein N7499_001518 [Penicillium canescens]|uniref:Uncharacterized protein n=1 Tax=Penicillium canescens TaxID=5083 RepID=A0AAD6I5J4_PENCN|nr:uncharacterized protein N7446_009058 [Penicillium canescens]KAJ5981473.1 hypothetical protein N7522_013894 [Penicillium canescens]KAJ6034310.1 hypothetical protein N7460_008485 [Penicillium canescens]KAJ6045972.1 hypothetical protein N7444_007226 [Penicillium canescens]KAJ6053046.1 hypothetical protein N7446_009058 [Penicillium canescens]KAJ6097144.1 hypothetical protein N7499_001518 [Penicillium canescens]
MAKIPLDRKASTPALSPDGVVGTVQFAAGVVNNSESQSKSRYMLVSEGDVENKHMVIMWELDEHGKAITSASIHT